MNLGIHAVKLLSYDPPEVKRFYDPRLHARCARGHIFTRNLAQCPVCRPHTSFFCTCGHSRYTHANQCLRDGCQCERYKATISTKT